MADLDELRPPATATVAWTAATAAVETLVRAGMRVAFGVPGEHIDLLYGATGESGQMRHIVTRHEQGAAFAADGYARASGDRGLCITTTGPGATNTLTPLVEAYAASSPVLVLAGQIPAAIAGQWKGYCHEITDQAAMFRPVTGYAATPRRAEDIPQAVASAIASLDDGVPRPAYVELPVDLLGLPVSGPVAVPASTGNPPDARAVRDVAARLDRARRPLVIAGGGVVRARATAELVRLARLLDAPVLTTLSGNGAAGEDRLLAGTLTYWQERGPTFQLLADADLVLVVGSRLDSDTTGRWQLPLHDVVQIDIDPGNLARNYPIEMGIAGDARSILAALADELGSGPRPGGSDWGAVAASWARDEADRRVPAHRATELAFIRRLRTVVPPETILSNDSAMISVWFGWFWRAFEPGTFLFPLRSSALGFAVPAGNGAAVAAPDRPVVAAVGDGGFLFTATELATAVRYGLNLNVVVFNDNRYGSIADDQIQRLGRNVSADLTNPDFIAFARSFGIPAQRVELAEAADAIAAAAREPGPSLVEVPGAIGSPWG